MHANAKGSTAVRAHRLPQKSASRKPRWSDGAPWQQHELFPTPPWGTRALFHYVMPWLGVYGLSQCTAWDPCAGLGHMADVIDEFTRPCFRTDVFDYEGAYGRTVDFCKPQLAQMQCDWVFANPPFSLAEKMLRNALHVSTSGVAFLLRSNWQEGGGRYRNIFCTPHSPTIVAPFAARLTMCEGGYDPDLSGATSYAWFVWHKGPDGKVIHHPGFDWASGDIWTRLIPPQAKEDLTRAGDRAMAARCMPGFIPPSLLAREKARATKARLDV